VLPPELVFHGALSPLRAGTFHEVICDFAHFPLGLGSPTCEPPPPHAGEAVGSWEGLPCREARSLPSARLALSTSIHSVTLSSTLHHTSAAGAAKHPRGAVFRKCGPAWTRRETQHRATPRVSTCPRAAGDCSGWLHCMCVWGRGAAAGLFSASSLSVCRVCFLSLFPF